MKDFFKTKLGRAIAAGLSTAIIWAIFTPLFDLIFHGGINWDVYKYVLEPIFIGIFICLIEYFLPSANNEKNKK